MAAAAGIRGHVWPIVSVGESEQRGREHTLLILSLLEMWAVLLRMGLVVALALDMLRAVLAQRAAMGTL